MYKEADIEKSKKERLIRNGASWFFWIAGLSVINSIILMMKGEWNFIVGLGITQIVDGFFIGFSQGAHNTGIILKAMPIIINTFISGIFVVFGIFAGKKSRVMFMIGMILYLLDGFIFVWIQDYLSIGFHIFALVSMFIGFWNIGELKKMEKMMRSDADAGSGTDNDSLPHPVSLRQRSERKNIRIGFAIKNDFRDMPDTDTYMRIAKTEFNILTPENQMKWNAIHPEKEGFNFAPADSCLEFAEETGMAAHGHTLVWHNQNPGWLKDNVYSKIELISILHHHIDTVVSRYKGRILIWDVVNEAFDDAGAYRASFWHNIIGKEYIEIAFSRAHAADPGARLIYNDYNIETICPKSDAAYTLAKDFLARGIPIHGIGIQAHLEGSGIDYQSFASNMQRFAELGLEIYITEMDVRIPVPAVPEEIKKQGDVYREIIRACMKQPACRAIQFWGFTDAYSWIPGQFKGTGAALIYDENYKQKPVYDVIIAALAE